MVRPGIEPGTFCVLGRRDNRYTIEPTSVQYFQHISLQNFLLSQHIVSSTFSFVLHSCFAFINIFFVSQTFPNYDLQLKILIFSWISFYSNYIFIIIFNLNTIKYYFLPITDSVMRKFSQKQNLNISFDYFNGFFYISK